MTKDLKIEIIDFMKKSGFCTLATVGRKSVRPHAIGYESILLAFGTLFSINSILW